MCEEHQIKEFCLREVIKIVKKAIMRVFTFENCPTEASWAPGKVF